MLVVGGATGMGDAAAQTPGALGAEVVVMDYAPINYEVAQAINVDLRDRGCIDSAIEAMDEPVNAIFSAAGVAEGPDLMKINYIGHRHLIERMLADRQHPRGSAISYISSVAGIVWENDLPRLQEFLATPDFESADAWVKAHESEGIIHYGFSEQVINAYVATQAYPSLTKGVRINAICPGPTDTPLARADAGLWLTFAQDYRDATGCQIHTPEQMGNAMVFLCSDAACAISGINLLVDNGHVMSSVTGSFAPGKPIIDLIMGRVSLT